MSKIIFKNQTGFSLLEVLISITVFTIAASGMLPAFNAFTGSNSFSHVRVGALQAAEQTLDNLRGTDPTTLPLSGSSNSQIMQIGKYSYSVKTFYCEEASLCIAGSTRHLRVEIKRNNEIVFDIQTVFTSLK
jgi:prepilin-type N-terminal cleavage/methylation domain-containing protein